MMKGKVKVNVKGIIAIVLAAVLTCGNALVSLAETQQVSRAVSSGGNNYKTFSADCGTIAAILEEGSLYMWGRNNFGQVGNGTTKNQVIPKKILSDVKHVKGYYYKTVAITENGDLYAWGRTSPYDSIIITPRKVLSDVRQVEIELNTTAAITEENDLYMWGLNYYGQLGNGTTQDQTKPQKILSNVKHIELEEEYAAAITEDGSLYMWGRNNYGQIGNGSHQNEIIPQKILSDVRQVEIELNTTAAITEDGSLYMWGQNDCGQIGNGSRQNEITPQKILSNVKSVELSGGSTVAITEDGNLYAWGENGYGQLGNGTTQDQTSPQKILPDVKQMTINDDIVAAITEDGSLYMWGENFHGRVGNGTTQDQTTPQKILSGVKDVELGWGTTAVITETDVLYTWGYNGYGQVGNGTTKNQLSPKKILSEVGVVKLDDITAAITKEGSLYMWGCNDCGQIGYGTTTNQLVPIKILDNVRMSNSENTDEIVKKTFNEHIYRADQLLYKKYNDVNQLTYFKNQIYTYSPSRIFLGTGELESMNDIWREVTTTFDTMEDISTISDYHFEQDDVYTTIILNALEESIDCELIDATSESIVLGTKEIVGYINDYFKLERNIDLLDDANYRKLSLQDKEILQNQFEKALKESGISGAAIMASDGLKYLDEYMDSAKCLESFVNNVLTYANLYLVTDSMANVLDEMYELTPNDMEHYYMKSSLAFCSRMIKASQEEFLTEILFKGVWTSAGKYGLQKTVGFFWEKLTEKVKIAVPEFAVLSAAYKVSRTVTNALYNTDNISEQIYKMSVLNQYYFVLDDAIMSLVKEYKRDSTEINAKNILNSMNLLYDFAYEDCEISYKYLDAVESATMMKILAALEKIGLLEGTNYKNAKTFVELTSQHIQENENSLNTGWIELLKDEYPEYYWDYAHLIGDDNKPLVVPITSSYSIECPVNVYVYDNENNLVAYLEDEASYATGNVTVSRNGDHKTVDFYDDAEYRIVCEGYDAGEMDIHITEYENQEVIREAAFYDLKVQDSVSYEMDKKNSPKDSENYVIMTENNDIIADYDSNLVEADETIELKMQGGFFSMQQGPEFELNAYAGERIDICAYVPEGYRFVKWYCSAGDEYIGDLSALTTTLVVPDKDVVVRAITEKIQRKVTRVAGTTRYDIAYTVAEIYKEHLGVEKFDTVIIANGNSFADALSAPYLASVKKAPILFTDSTKDDIKRLHNYIKSNVTEGGKVYIVGSEGGVSSAVGEIKGYEVVRTSGSRYETNIAILNEAGIDSKTLIVSSGKYFRDGLAALALGKPILLVNNILSDMQKKFIETSGIEEIYIIGNTDIVSEEIEVSLREYKIPVYRIAGDDYSATSVAVAQTMFTDPTAVIVTHADSFTEGLCVAPLAAELKIPLLTVKENAADVVIDYVENNAIFEGYVIGSQQDVSDKTIIDIFSLNNVGEIILRESDTVCKIFTDVPHGAWYEGYVQYVYDNDYMTGSNSLFNPTKDITRAQLVTILYRMVGSPKVTDRSAIADFSDIAEDSYYTNAVCWAYTEGIAAGNDGKFNPGGKLTRQQMAAFLYRFAEVMGYDTDKRGDYSNMLNADEVSAYAKEAVSWAVGEGFISGSAKTDKNGNLVYDLIPRGNTSRAQLASVMQRFCEQYGL